MRLSEASEQQRHFVRLVIDGVTPSRAAEMAGYACPEQYAGKLLAQPRIQAEIAAARRRVFETDLAPKALSVLRAALAEGVDWRHRLRAAEIILKHCADNGDTPESLEAMSVNELADVKRILLEQAARLEHVQQPVTVIDMKANESAPGKLFE